MCRTRKAALSAALAALLAAPPVAAEDLKPALKAMTEFLALDGRPIPAIRPQEPVQIRVSITSGLGGVFPRGLYVGEVLACNDDGTGQYDAVVSLDVDYAHLEQVLVIVDMDEVVTE